jgi:transposase
MLHNEARELLVKAYENNSDADYLAKVFSISKSSVFRLVAQKRKTGSVELQVSKRGRKPILSEEDKQKLHN